MHFNFLIFSKGEDAMNDNFKRRWEDYSKNFNDKQRKKALEVALDIRKFEIELFWKRATYFWIFISLIFVGYYTILDNETLSNAELYKVAVSYIGLVFSFSWYLVNRGSKFWQNNWELHVDFLEDQEIGPLYKMMIDNRSCACEPLKPYPFSVSRINILISLYVVLIWLSISILSTVQYFQSDYDNTLVFFILIAAFNLIVMQQLMFKMKSSDKVSDDFFILRNR